MVYEDGRVIQAAPRAELLSQPSSRSVARIMGIRNLMQGARKGTPDRIQFRWRGQTLEAVNSPTRSYLPAPDSPLAFFVRPEYVRLIRKDRTGVDGSHHMNLMVGTVVREVDLGASWTLFIRLDEPGAARAGRLRSRARSAAARLRESRDRSRPALAVLAASRRDPRAALRLMAATPVIAMLGVRVSRAGRAILEISELAVDPGQVLAVIGPNGAGKSTLLRVMGLLEPATAGSVRFQGEPVSPAEGLGGAAAHGQRLPGAAPRRHHRRDNVALGLRFRGVATSAPRRGWTRG